MSLPPRLLNYAAPCIADPTCRGRSDIFSRTHTLPHACSLYGGHVRKHGLSQQLCRLRDQHLFWRQRDLMHMCVPAARPRSADLDPLQLARSMELTYAEWCVRCTEAEGCVHTHMSAACSSCSAGYSCSGGLCTSTFGRAGCHTRLHAARVRAITPRRRDRMAFLILRAPLHVDGASHASAGSLCHRLVHAFSGHRQLQQYARASRPGIPARGPISSLYRCQTRDT